VVKKKIKILQKFIGGFFLFSVIETKILKRNNNIYPPIFLIGPPRSGSTLLYQLLITHFHLCYFSNLSNFFYKAPVAIHKILPPKNYKIKKSEFGFIKGLNAPSECGGICRYWFDSLKYNKKTKDLISNSIYTLSNFQNAPFIIKNLNNNFRINKIAEIFPNAIFVYITRDLLYNAQSLLLARKKQNGSYLAWFGLKPDNFSRILKIDDPFLQVFTQIESINKYIQESIEKTNAYVLKLDYEDICKNPIKFLDTFENEYNKISIKNIKRKNIEVENILNENKKKMNESDWNKLIIAQNKL